ncbi:Protein F23D12.1 [Aphelenchoides avenae]|nr:Protein F23D12.1 [Aphelenchus avenae]
MMSVDSSTGGQASNEFTNIGWESARRVSKASLVLGTVMVGVASADKQPKPAYVTGCAKDLSDSVQPLGMGQSSNGVNGTQNFNPNAKRYRACCCHVKTFVVAFGIVEIFIICFLLVAVVPDLKKTCDEESDVDDAAARQLSNVTVPQEMGQNATAYANNLGIDTIHKVSCNMTIVWLAWAVLQIIAVNVMFYAVKSVRWVLFIPHIVLRVGCAVALGILIALLAMGIFGDYPEGTSRAGIIVLFCLSLACLAWLFYLLPVPTGLKLQALRQQQPLRHKIKDTYEICLHFGTPTDLDKTALS